MARQKQKLLLMSWRHIHASQRRYDYRHALHKVENSFSHFSANVKEATRSKYSKNLAAQKVGSPLVPKWMISTARTGLTWVPTIWWSGGWRMPRRGGTQRNRGGFVPVLTVSCRGQCVRCKPVISNLGWESSIPVYVSLLPRLSALRAAWLVRT